jgi:hypothetical protein
MENDYWNTIGRGIRDSLVHGVVQPFRKVFTMLGFEGEELVPNVFGVGSSCTTTNPAYELSDPTFLSLPGLCSHLSSW